MNFKLYFGFSLTVIILLIITSCSHRISNVSSSASIVYPPPPATVRIQYLTSISNSNDIMPKQSVFNKSIVGAKKSLAILKPYGVFIRNGKIYICDVSIGGLEIIDLKKKEFDYFIPEAPYKLELVLSSYVDEENQLYIVDAELQKIVVFDKQGNFVTSFGKKENKKPTDIFIYGNSIWVADPGNHRINVYDKDTFEFDYYFPKSVAGNEDYVYKPTNIFVSEDKVYVSDMGNAIVKIFTHKGEYLNSVGKMGKNLGEFVRPKGLAVDKESNLYVVDASFENIQIFNKKGELLLFFGGAYKGHGDMWLPTQVVIDYDNLEYFEEYVDPKFDLKYLIIVANQFGPDKISIYGRVELKE